MAEFRDAMEEELRLRNYSESTRETYAYCVREQVKFVGLSPDVTGPEDVRRYLMHLAQKPVSWSFFNQSVCALRFFYGRVLKRDWSVERIPFHRRGRKLPVILDPDEVERVLAAASSLRDRALFEAAYGCGLRLSEIRHLKVSDIDRRGSGQRPCSRRRMHALPKSTSAAYAPP